MAEVKLDFVTDLSPIDNALTKANTSINKTQNEVLSLGKDTANAFSKATTEANKYTTETKKATGQTSALKDSLEKIPGAAQTLRQLNLELVKAAATAAQAKQGTNEWREALEKAGEAKEKIVQLRQVLGGVANNEGKRLQQAFTAAAQTGIEGFEGIVAAESLFGIKNEEVEQQLLKLRSLSALSNILGEFTQLGEKVNLFKSAFVSLGTIIKANTLGFLLTTVSALSAAFLYLKNATEVFGISEEKALNKSIENTNEELALLKKEYEYRIAIAQASGKNIAELESEASKEQIKLINDQLNELEKFERKKGLTEEQSAAQKKLFEEYDAIAGKRNITGAKLVADRIKLEKDFVNQYNSLQISLIRDDKTREIAAAKQKLNIEFDASKERINLLFDEKEAGEQIGLQKEILNARLNEEIFQINKKYADKRLALEKELQQLLFDLASKIEGKTEEEKIQKIQESALHELSILKENIILKGKEIDKGYKLNAEQLEQFSILEQQVYSHSTDALVKLNVDRANKISAANLANVEKSKSNIETSFSADTQAIEATPKPAGMNELNFEESIQKAKLQLQITYAPKRLDAAKQELSAKREVDIKALNGELDLISNKDDEQSNTERANILKKLDLTEAGYAEQNRLLQNTFDAAGNIVQKGLSKINAKKPVDFASLLGISTKDLQNLQMALTELTTALDATFKVNQDALDKEITASKTREDAYKSQISSLQDKLKTEQNLNDQGATNNSDRIKQEILDLQAKQAAEDAIQNQALQNKKKIQQEQLLLDSLTQLSNLAVAATNIFLQATAEEGPIGVPVAIAAIGIMTAAFIASKIAALKAINNSFAEGGYTGDGGKHEEAGTVHKGEFVTTKENTKKHRPLLEAMHDKNSIKYKHALLKELVGTGVIMDRELPQKLNSQKSQITYFEKNNRLMDISSLEKRIDATNEKLDKLIESGAEKIFLDQNGNLVSIKGSNRKVLRKK